jgi:hypothetical protein
VQSTIVTLNVPDLERANDRSKSCRTDQITDVIASGSRNVVSWSAWAGTMAIANSTETRLSRVSHILIGDMTRDEVTKKLRQIGNRGTELLHHLDRKPHSEEDEAELRRLAQVLQDELRVEYERMLPERVQKSLTVFEMSVYSLTIDEAWKGTGMSRLKVDGAISGKWQEVFEAVVYKLSKYL